LVFLADIAGSATWLGIATLWNPLPAATVLSGSLQSLKKSIEDINFNYALLGKY